MFRDRFAQERVALLRPVPPERGIVSHFVNGSMERLDARFRQRPRHVADPEPDDFPVRMVLLVLCQAFVDFDEKVR